VKVIHVLRKPCSREAGTVASNVLRHGTGAINVDGCRVAFASPEEAERHSMAWDRGYNPNSNSSPIHTWDNAIGNHPGSKRTHGGGPKQTAGRWPANLILTEGPAVESFAEFGEFGEYFQTVKPTGEP